MRKKAFSILLACLCMFSAACGSNSKKAPEHAEPQVKEPAIETGRQDGERFETTIILEGMEEKVRYEHIRDEALGFEMDYDYEIALSRAMTILKTRWIISR